MLNRLGYRLRWVLKARPENSSRDRRHLRERPGPSPAAAREPDTLRISLDTKAKVKVGNFSRGGRARGADPVKAVDHDMSPEAVLVPLGILELNRGNVDVHQPWISFGHSRETRDFIADGLEQWPTLL